MLFCPRRYQILLPSIVTSARACPLTEKIYAYRSLTVVEHDKLSLILSVEKAEGPA